MVGLKRGGREGRREGWREVPPSFPPSIPPSFPFTTTTLMTMTTHATGTFEVEDWSEATYHDLGDGAKLTRATVKQTFRGAIEGDACVEFLMTYATAESAFFVGMQR